MKKMLLSMAVAATAAFSVSAQTEYNVMDATDIQGTYFEEKPAEGTSSGQGARYQPLQSFKLGGLTFSFAKGTATTEPAYYYSMSTVATKLNTARIYNGNTMTITAPAGTNITKLEFTGSNLASGAVFTVDSGTWTSANNAVWEGSANSFTVTATGTWRWSKVKVTTGEGGGSGGDDNPGDDQTETTIFAESFASSLGDFTVDNVKSPTEIANVWIFKANYGAVASGYAGGVAYDTEGWLISPEIDLTSCKNVTMSFEHVINYFTSVDAAKQETGVYMRVNGGDWTTLPVDYPTALGWSPWVSSGNVSLSAGEGKKIQLGFKYISTTVKAGTWEVKNLVVKGINTGADIKDVIDFSAPVEYYNLQGAKVANPEKGVYIVRQGAKVAKVLR